MKSTNSSLLFIFMNLGCLPFASCRSSFGSEASGHHRIATPYGTMWDLQRSRRKPRQICDMKSSLHIDESSWAVSEWFEESDAFYSSSSIVTRVNTVSCSTCTAAI